jgi:hypothetical protein
MPDAGLEEKPVSAMDERLKIALQFARKHKMSYWDAKLQEHRGHSHFKIQTWPHTLEYGFTCECSGQTEEWRISVRCIKEMLPDARTSVLQFYKIRLQERPKGHKAFKRNAHQAGVKAKALLHKFLTREQRLMLKHLGEFRVLGKDGREYILSATGGVKLEHEGHLYSFCYHPDIPVPACDTLLSQKIVLETEPEVLIRSANVWDQTTQERFQGGAFILGEAPRPTKAKVVTQMAVLDLDQDVLENPREWVENRLA